MKNIALPKFSIGWELEATERASRPIEGVVVDYDGSVNGESLEYRTAKRIVYEPEKSIASLRQLATDPTIKTDDSCGFHVHIGLGKKSRRIHEWAAAFVTLARHIEPEAFGAVPLSRRGSSFCRSWSDDPGSIITRQYVRDKHSCEGRYNWVNPVEIFRPGGIRTIEVRLMGNTHRYSYLLAWASFCRIMAASAWALSLDLSREQEEIYYLKEILATIRRTFLNLDVKSKERAKLAVVLAHKAGFLHPYGQPLGELVANEKWIRRLSDTESSEARRAWETFWPFYRPTFRAGNIVRCVARSHDGNLTVGREYTITQEERSGVVSVIGDNGIEWWVDPECLEAVEREAQRV